MTLSSMEKSKGMPANNTVLTDDITRVLNHADTFGVYNRWGNFLKGNKQLHGLYYRGTRHLSHYRLLINDKQPVLLNSELEEEFEALNVHMMNPLLYPGSESGFPQGVLHLKRRMKILNEHFEDKIISKNYGIRDISFELKIEFETDFMDLFEIRGFTRTERGHIRPYQLTESSVFSIYDGLDNVRRTTRANFLPIPDQIKFNEITYQITLAPQETFEIQSMFELINEQDDASRSRKPLILSLPHITSSNEQFNHWLNRSKTDLYALIASTEYGPYPYAGIPWFNTAFGRDGIITAFSVLWVMPELAKDVLIFLAATQATYTEAFSEAQPGRILHERRNSEMANLGEVPFKLNYGSIDATPLFVFLAGRYYRRTADGKTIDSIWPAIERAMRWLENDADLDGDGFYEYHKHGVKGLVNQGWKDADDAVSHSSGALAESPIALCEVQGYAYGAYQEAAFLAEKRGLAEKMKHWKTKAQTLKTQFNDHFWDEELGTYVLALDKNNDPCRVRSSNAGHTLAFMMADQPRAEKLASTLMNSSLYSGWGIRTMAKGEKRFSPIAYHNGTIWPHDNAIIAYGLSKYGMNTVSNRIFKGLFESSLHFENQRLPELFCGFNRVTKEGPVQYPVACSPQAWSVASIYLLLKASLNVEVNALKKTIRFRQPKLPDFLDSLIIHQLPVTDGHIALEILKYPNNTGINILENKSDWKIEVEK